MDGFERLQDGMVRAPGFVRRKVISIYSGGDTIASSR